MGLSFGGESSSRVGRELNAARLSRVTRVSRRSSYDRRPVVFCLVPCALIRGTDDGRPNTMDACGCASRQRPSPPALGPPRAPGVAVVARAPLRPPQSRGGAKTLRLTVRSGRYRAADGGRDDARWVTQSTRLPTRVRTELHRLFNGPPRRDATVYRLEFDTLCTIPCYRQPGNHPIPLAARSPLLPARRPAPEATGSRRRRRTVVSSAKR